MALIRSCLGRHGCCRSLLYRTLAPKAVPEGATRLLPASTAWITCRKPVCGSGPPPRVAACREVLVPAVRVGVARHPARGRRRVKVLSLTACGCWEKATL
jgi:hypothetical protein